MADFSASALPIGAGFQTGASFPGGFAGGFGGPFGGLSKNVDVDIGAGAFPGGVGGSPGFGGWGGPYVPVTPLGALGGIKGDLLVPIVIVGFAIFILLIIVLAVKAALTWKVEALDELAGHRFVRDATSGSGVDQTELDRLTTLLYNALTQNCWSQRMLCECGKLTKDYMPMIEVVKLVTPESMVPALDVLKESALSDELCEKKYPCQTMPTSHSDVLKEQEHLNGTTFHNNTLTA